MFGEGIVRYLRRQSEPMFFDTCVRVVASEADAGYGYGKSYADGATLACLFRPRPQTDQQGDSDVPVVMGDVYFPRGTELLPDDRLRITHLHGDAVANPQTYAIEAGPVENHIHMHAELAPVTDGSDE